MSSNRHAPFGRIVERGAVSAFSLSGAGELRVLSRQSPKSVLSRAPAEADPIGAGAPRPGDDDQCKLLEGRFGRAQARRVSPPGSSVKGRR